MEAKGLGSPNTASRDLRHTLKCHPSVYKNAAIQLTQNKENPETTCKRKSNGVTGIENLKETSSHETNGNWRSQLTESNSSREITGNWRSGNLEGTSHRERN